MGVDQARFTLNSAPDSPQSLNDQVFRTNSETGSKFLHTPTSVTVQIENELEPPKYADVQAKLSQSAKKEPKQVKFSEATADHDGKPAIREDNSDWSPDSPTTPVGKAGVQADEDSTSSEDSGVSSLKKSDSVTDNSNTKADITSSRNQTEADSGSPDVSSTPKKGLQENPTSAHKNTEASKTDRESEANIEHILARNSQGDSESKKKTTPNNQCPMAVLPQISVTIHDD